MSNAVSVDNPVSISATLNICDENACTIEKVQTPMSIGVEHFFINFK